MDSLTSSRFFVGVISSSDAGTFNIQVEPVSSGVQSGSTGLIQGIPLVHVFASTLGFKECPTYAVGSSVFCYSVNPMRCYIIGVIPDADVGRSAFYSRACLSTADSKIDEQNTLGYDSDYSKMVTINNNLPTDVVEGERVIANEFGVLLGLFQQMAVLKGSELAQIQCFLLDDLVRLVSHNFQHWSALGEFNIWHDGKSIMAEFGATHLAGESLGSACVNSSSGKPVFEKDGEQPSVDDSSDYYKISQDPRIRAIERIKMFMGRLGDFLHMFLVRPDPDAIRTLAGSVTGNFDTGLADFHVSLDGRISLRSVSSVVLEKTNWIMVPQRVRTPEDPKGDDGSELTFEDKDPFEFNVDYKYRENPTFFALQMRDCVAYLQDKVNYQNFKAYEKDFKFSGSPTSQENDLDSIDKVDEKTKVNFQDYKLRKSGLYLMDNGGVMLKDAWGSAIILEGGNIYLQPAKDLISQPLRNSITKAGQFVSICAKKDVDISSTEESFRLKTQKVQHFYSKEEGLLFQSDADDKRKPTPEEKAYDKFGGIVFKAKDAGVYTYSKYLFDRVTDKALIKAKELTLQAKDDDSGKGRLFLSSEEEMFVFPKKAFHLEGNEMVKILSKTQLMAAGQTDTIFGEKGKVITMVPAKGSMPAKLEGVLTVGDLAVLRDPLIDADEPAVGQPRMDPFDEDDKFDKIKFRFLASDKYNLNDQEDYIPMTIAQQDDDSFGLLGLGTWREKEMEQTLPFPGKEKFNSFYLTCSLTNLQPKGNDLSSKDSETLSSSPGSLTPQSLNSYKILQS